MQKTEIIEGEVKDGALLDALLRFSPEGSEIIYIFDKNVPACNEVKRILSRKYAVKLNSSEVGFDLTNAKKIRASEATRAIVTFGGGLTTDVGKFVASRYRLPLIAVISSPSTVGFLVPSAMLIGESGMIDIYKAQPPKAVICDETLITSSESIVASAYGDICARVSSLFDFTASKIITGEKWLDENTERGILSIIKETLELVVARKITAYKIAKLSLRLSEILARQGSSRLYCGGEYQISEGLRLIKTKRREDAKLWGERMLVCASITMRVYIAFLSLGVVHPHVVADNNARIDEMNQVFGVGALNVVNKLTPLMDFQTVDRTSYRMRARKYELLKKAFTYEKLLNFALCELKTLYNDCGYSYNNYVRTSDLYSCIRLAPEIYGKTTLFTLMKGMGLIG